MFCTACGARNAEISNFCKQCGHKLDRASAPRISEEAFDRALPLEEQVSALLERAYRLRKSGELSAAVRLCEEALHLNPESTSVHSLLGQIHEQMGNRGDAIHEYERVLLLNPGSIADRVKLDELRGDGLPTPLHPRSAPHIVMPNRTLPSPNGRQILGIAGVAGVLMLLGGLLALQFRPHQEKDGAPAASGLTRSARGTGVVKGAAAVASTAGTNASSDSSAPANSNGNPNASTPGLSPTGTYSPYTGYAPPPVYIRTPSPTVYIRDAPPYAESGRRGGTLPNMNNLRVQSVSDNGDTSDRIRLPDGGGGKYSITIPSEGSGDTTGADTSSKGTNAAPPKNQGSAATPKGGSPNGGMGLFPPKFQWHDNGHGNGGIVEGGIGAPTTDAQSQIAIASDKVKNGNYDEAIKVYRRALPGAGSQTGYVFQQMGICFQRIKDKTSAIEKFNQAIAEYQKLERANQQVDLARVGIKVCQNGIKLCNAE